MSPKSILMKTFEATVWCFCLFTLISSTLSLSIIPLQNSASKRFTSLPKIRLVSYLELYGNSIIKAEPEFQTSHQFENELLSKNGSDYILRQGLDSATFVCKARYPVLWTVPYPQQIMTQAKYSVTFTEYRSSIPSVGKPYNGGFYAWLHFYSEGQSSLSANFTCVSADPQTGFKQSSIYVFRGGWNAIERQGETLEVSVSPKDEQFVIPCRPGLPDLPIILEKQAENSTSYTELQLSPYLSFDPKIGFTMNKRLFGNKIFGMYRCKVSQNDYLTDFNGKVDENDVYVHINVINTDSDEVDKLKYFKIYKSISGNAKVEFSQLDGRFICCSGLSGIRPQMVLGICYSAGDCHVAKEQFLERIHNINQFELSDPYLKGDSKERDDCSKTYVQGTSTSSLIYCKGGNLKLLDNYMPAFRQNIQNIESRMINTEDLQIISYDAASAILSQPVESKIFIFVGFLEQSIRSHMQGLYLYEDYQLREFSTTKNLHVISYKTHIQEYDRNHYYEGEYLTFTCLALKFFYTAGIQMQLKWRNGTVTNFVQPRFDSIQVFLKGLPTHGRYELGVYHFFNEPIQADLDMKSVKCYIPKWNSSDWDVLTYNLDIRSPLLPEVEAKEETVYFKLFDSDGEIAFNVHGGLPAPKMISVFKDDKLIAKSTGHTSVVDEIQGLVEEIVDLHSLPKEESDESSESDSLNFASIANVTIEESNTTRSENASFVITIRFYNVTHDIQGIYRCVAESVKGNVTKDIHVFISERKNKTAKVALSLVVVLGILLVGIGVWHKVQHKAVQMLRFGMGRL